MDEQKKYEVIKKLVEGKGNKNAAALKLGITPRHVNRLIEAYKKKGKEAFVHGNRGRKPSRTTTNGEFGVVILEKDCILYQAGGLDELDVFTEDLFVDGPEQIALRNTKHEDNYFLRLAAT